MKNAFINKCENLLKNQSLKSAYSISNIFLYLISQCYRLFIFIRNCLYDLRFFKEKKASVPVISIGNVVAGGSGKTSFTMLLANDLNIPVGILSGGYMAKKKVLNKCIERPDEGDEAFLLSKKVSCARVIVGKNRTKSATIAVGLGVKYILLDDGMQHRALYRDLDVIVVHAKQPLDDGYFLPRGFLRDSPKRLKFADYIVIHGAKSVDEFNNISKKISKHSQAKVIGTSYLIDNVKQLYGKKVGAFCGIGHPESFYDMLKEIGCEIVSRVTLPDHSEFYDVKNFIYDCVKNGAQVIVCTEKDYVKICYYDKIVPLVVIMNVIYGEMNYKNLLDKIKILLHK